MPRKLPVFETLLALGGFALGGALALDLNLALIGWVGLIGLMAFAAPAWAWAAAALVSAVLLRSLITFGVLPSVMTFADIPLAWGALAVALIRSDLRAALGRRMLLLLACLASTIAVSWAFSGTEIARPILYLLLLGQPFAIVTAFVLDPPTKAVSRKLKLTLAGIVALQVPVSLLQYLLLGSGGGEGNLDNVQGTLFGAGAGHHAMAAIVTIGAVWLLSNRSIGFAARLGLALPLFGIVFLADAKQILFALPATVVAIRLRDNFGVTLARIIAVGLAFFAVVTLYEPGRVALGFIQGASETRGGKIAVAQLLNDRISETPATFAFGLGPATTVSRTSFMTTDLFLKEDSPLRSFGLSSSTFALEAAERARSTTIGESSFNSATSSALGVIGDIGWVGMIVYVSILFVLILNLRRVGSAAASAAAAGWGMFAVLGFVFDWWEQPPLAVFLAVLTGLALTDRPRTEQP